MGSEAGRTVHEHCRPVRGRVWRLQPVDRSAPKCCLDDYYLLLLPLASCCSALLGVLTYPGPDTAAPSCCRIGASWALWCAAAAALFGAESPYLDAVLWT